MPTAAENSEALHEARFSIDQLRNERALLTTGTEQAKAEPDTLATRICQLKAAA